MNNTMSTTSQFKDLKDFLVKHSAKGASPGTPFTHTRIADQNSNIYANYRQTIYLYENKTI